MKRFMKIYVWGKKVGQVVLVILMSLWPRCSKSY